MKNNKINERGVSMIETDCFAFDKEKFECTALTDLYCKDKKCKFYKTREQLKEEQKKARRHIV